MITRIGIAHHNREFLRSLRALLNGKADFSVVWIVASGPGAISEVVRERPDVILLDINLPGGGGVHVTQEVMEKAPCQIIIMSEDIENSSAEIFRAMRFGAVDTFEITEDQKALPEQEVRLVRKIQKIGMLRQTEEQGEADIEPLQGRPHDPQPIHCSPRPVPDRNLPLVLIGSSTGGPQALARIIEGLPENIASPVIIIQHLQQEFSANLASWLAKQGFPNVKLAEGGESPEAGTIYVASTNDHMILTPGLRFRYTSEPEEIPFRPSVDVFFHSAAAHWPGKGLAIILTGMGNDGAKGLAELHRLGWYTIAQDKETSLAHGMPRAAVKMKAVVESLPIGDIAMAINDFLERY